MFDISFAEMAVVAIVALVVLGPERLPGAARTAGKAVRMARQQWRAVTETLNDPASGDAVMGEVTNHPEPESERDAH